MEDDLKRMLDAETRAEAMVDDTRRECARLMEQARMEARAAEQRMEERIPQTRSALLEDAEKRAAAAVVELERRYQDQGEQLRSLARRHAEEAVAAALALICDPGWE